MSASTLVSKRAQSGRWPTLLDRLPWRVPVPRAVTPAPKAVTRTQRTGTLAKTPTWLAEMHTAELGRLRKLFRKHKAECSRCSAQDRSYWCRHIVDLDRRACEIERDLSRGAP